MSASRFTSTRIRSKRAALPSRARMTCGFRAVTCSCASRPWQRVVAGFRSSRTAARTASYFQLPAEVAIAGGSTAPFTTTSGRYGPLHIAPLSRRRSRATRSRLENCATCWRSTVCQLSANAWRLTRRRSRPAAASAPCPAAQPCAAGLLSGRVVGHPRRSPGPGRQLGSLMRPRSSENTSERDGRGRDQGFRVTNASADRLRAASSSAATRANPASNSARTSGA